MIGSISGYGYSPYLSPAYSMNVQNAGSKNAGNGLQGVNALGIDKAGGQEESKNIKNPGESTQVAPGKKSSPAECETCKERKYQDGSDEMVSFKSPSHVSPNAAGIAVRAHEQEHVSNAYKKASKNNGQVMQASVSIQTAVCPECGRTYVSGGQTTTQIKYSNEDNPYQKARKAMDGDRLRGANLDLAV